MSWWCTCCQAATGILWSGNNTGKLFLESGLFTSTIKTSQAVTTIDVQPQGISWNGTDVPWTGIAHTKYYIQSGVFSSVLKTSSVAFASLNSGIGWDATNTFGLRSIRMILVSGHFTSTIKTSQTLNTHASPATGISWNGTDTPWSGQRVSTAEDWLWKTSGSFTSTIKTSQRVDTISTTTAVGGVGNESPNILFAAQTESGGTKGKFFQMSGQFSSTLKTSLQAPVNRVNDMSDQAFTTG